MCVEDRGLESRKGYSVLAAEDPQGGETIPQWQLRLTTSVSVVEVFVSFPPTTNKMGGAVSPRAQALSCDYMWQAWGHSPGWVELLVAQSEVRYWCRTSALGPDEFIGQHHVQGRGELLRSVSRHTPPTFTRYKDVPVVS